MFKRYLLKFASVCATVVLMSSAASAGSMYQVDRPDYPCPSGFKNLDPGNGKYYCDQTEVVVTEGAKTANPRSAPAAKPTPHQVATHERARGSNDQITQITQASTSVPAADSSPGPIAVQSSVKKLKPEPEGNFFIVTYLDDPRTKAPKDRRLGKVKVSIAREGGNSGCSTHASGTGLTNGASEAKLKDGRTLLVKGTIHFANCNAGKYTVTTEGRKGYKVISKSVKQYTLSDNETQRVNFILAVDKK